MFYKVLYAMSGLLGLVLMSLTKDVFARAIIVLQVIAISCTALGFWLTLGMLLFALATLLIVFYAFVRVPDRAKRSVVLLIALPNLLMIAFAVNHWPGANMIALFMVIPVMAYTLGVLRNWKAYKNEIGFLTVLVLSAIGVVINTVDTIISNSI